MSRLERWSRIKRGLEPEDPSPDATREVPAQHDAQPSPTAGESPTQPRSTEGTPESDGREDANETATRAKTPPPPGSLDDTLPDPETLEAGSDFTGYMVPGVSSALRRRALKRLWATGNYNVRDGLDDYDLDYTQQLKPMASELAGKLRRWAKKADESLNEEVEQASRDASDASPASETQVESPESSGSGPATAHTSPLDEQPDKHQTKA